jgi:hypothetical protein
LQTLIDRFADVEFEIHTGSAEIVSALQAVFPRFGSGGGSGAGDGTAVRLTVRPQDLAGRTRYSLMVDERLEAEALSGDEAVALIEHQIIRNTVLKTTRYLAIHAAAVAGPSGALVLAGAGGCGKSRLCAELVARGFDYLSDELTLVHLDRKNVGPFPRAILLKPEGARGAAGAGHGAVASVADGRRYVDWESLRAGSTTGERSVWKVALCRFEHGGATAVSRVSAEDAFHALLGLTLNVNSLGASIACDTLWDIVSSAAVEKVVFGSAEEGASACV